MSGGSFNYLYCKDIDQLFEDIDAIDDMEYMAIWLANVGKYHASNVTFEYLAQLKTLKELIETQLNELDQELEKIRPVMKAAEWWYSNDWGEDDFNQAWQNYINGENAQENSDSHPQREISPSEYPTSPGGCSPSHQRHR